VFLRPSQRDRSLVDLPAWLSVAYVLVRPLRLAWNGISLLRDRQSPNTSLDNVPVYGAAAPEMPGDRARETGGRAVSPVVPTARPNRAEDAGETSMTHGRVMTGEESVSSDMHA